MGCEWMVTVQAEVGGARVDNSFLSYILKE
jgi:hypothetical protein